MEIVVGVLLLVAGVVLAAMCAGPWSYGFGAMVGVVVAVCGYAVLTREGATS